MTLKIEIQKRLATVNQLAELYPSFSKSSIRWLIFNQMANGFSTCIRKIGRKILIDLDAFEAWIDQQSVEVTHAK